jgi:hypothetical protein
MYRFSNKEKNKKFWEEFSPIFLLYDMSRIKDDWTDKHFIFACVSVAAVMFLLSRYLATIGRNTYRQRLKYAVEMGSGAMIYMPSFIQLVQAFES